MFNIILTIHLVLCIALVFLVLLQQGKGADLGASFGGASNTLFGAAGATTLLVKITTGVAISFMFTSILLVKAYNGLQASSVLDRDVVSGSVLEQPQPPAPAEGSAQKPPAEAK